MRSQLWATQDALFTMLDGATWPGRVAVSIGIPDLVQPDHVWISGEVDDWNANYRVSGLAAKDERFVLRVHVYSKRIGGFADTRDRIIELGEVVEDTISADHTLTGTVNLATIVKQQIEETQNEDGRGRTMLLTFYVECSAHISA